MGFLRRLFGDATATDLPHAADPTDAPIPQPPMEKGGRDKGRRERVYTVKEGDTPQLIARRVYGNPDLWSRIAEANRERLGDPPVLYPGLELDLP